VTWTGLKYGPTTSTCRKCFTQLGVDNAGHDAIRLAGRSEEVNEIKCDHWQDSILGDSIVRTEAVSLYRCS
jgi:hypothetical protein